MCQKNLTGPYPCGHVTESWEYCDAKRRRAVLHNSPLKPPEKQTVIPCSKPFVVEWPPMLNTPCARTCLTKPFMCCQCGLADRWNDETEKQAPQVGWTCERCEHVRCQYACSVWTGCGCKWCNGAVCRELVLQLMGDDVEGKRPGTCALCLEGACEARQRLKDEEHMNAKKQQQEEEGAKGRPLIKWGIALPIL